MLQTVVYERLSTLSFRFHHSDVISSGILISNTDGLTDETQSMNQTTPLGSAKILWTLIGHERVVRLPLVLLERLKWD